MRISRSWTGFSDPYKNRRGFRRPDFCFSEKKDLKSGYGEWTVPNAFFFLFFFFLLLFSYNHSGVTFLVERKFLDLWLENPYIDLIRLSEVLDRIASYVRMYCIIFLFCHTSASALSLSQSFLFSFLCFVVFFVFLFFVVFC